jgi:hypothetical protein
MQRGSRGDHVITLQHTLNAAGRGPLDPDGRFGPRTESAVKAFQSSVGIKPTGEVDSETRAALRKITGTSDPGRLGLADYSAAADSLGISCAAMRAIVAVESRGAGFLLSGRPVILFERHIMRRRLVCRFLPTEGHDPNIVSSTPGGYRGGEAEWVRFTAASKISPDAAIESASWGLFQIMGMHWERLGYKSPTAWQEAMSRAEFDQLDAFLRFLRDDPSMIAAIKAEQWDVFARKYNGPSYAKNQYDKKLSDAYAAALQGRGCG